MKRLLKSMKFWSAVAGLVVVIGVEAAAWDQGSADSIAKTVLALIALVIGGTVIEDTAAKIKGGSGNGAKG